MGDEPIPARDRSQVRFVRAVMRANAAFRSHFKDSKGSAIGLSMTEFDFLAALGNTGGLRMSDLAHAMITTPSNVTRVCAAMEKKGLAVRERSTESDREVIAKLTPAGQRRFEEVFVDVVDWTVGAIDRVATADDQRAVADVLDRMVTELTPK